jgi:hypothetical protein
MKSRDLRHKKIINIGHRDGFNKTFFGVIDSFLGRVRYFSQTEWPEIKKNSPIFGNVAKTAAQ